MIPPAVVIVGAGALGLATAWHLHERGVADITIVDGDHPISGSSGLSVGYVQTQHLSHLNIELRAVAMRVFDALADEYGLIITRNGYVRIGFSAEQMDCFEQSIEIQREFGITHPRIVDREGLRQLIPDMRVDDTEGALVGPRDGFLDGHLYCTLLYEVLSNQGVRVLPKTGVVGCEDRNDGAIRLHTTRGTTIDADFVVNAAGAWATEVAGLLGTSVPVRPERHQAVIARLPEALPYVMPCVMTYSPGSGTQGVFFRHERPGHLVVGMHSTDPIGEVVDPDDFRRSNDLEFLEEVAEHLVERMPSFEHAALGDGWAGIYPMSHDGLPIVGPSPGHPNVIQANGAGGAGIMLSPVIGRIASEWIVDGAVSCISEPDALAPERLNAITGGTTT